MNDIQKVKVWECKIVVPADAELPPGFDYPPRIAAIKAIQNAGVPVLACASGWGGSLTREEQEFLEFAEQPDIYFAGVMDAPDDVPH